MPKNHPKIYTKLPNTGYGYKHRDLALLETWTRYWQKGRVKLRQTAFTCTTTMKTSDTPFSSSEPTILLACGRNRELWEQPFWNNKGNNRILPIRFNSVFIYGACPKWLLPELSIPAAGQKDRRLWGREWWHTQTPTHGLAVAAMDRCFGLMRPTQRSNGARVRSSPQNFRLTKS